MIDFRYHLVSLISVFLALAVGIVLGAGPLKGPLGESLQSQVESLRSDRDDLRTQLDAANGDVDALNRFASAAAPELLGDALVGKDVLVVQAESSEAAQVDAVVERIGEAGGSVVDQATLRADALSTDGDFAATVRSIDPKLPADDAEAVRAALVLALGAPRPGADAPSPTADPTSDATASADADEIASRLFAAFADAGRLSAAQPAPADAVLLVAPAALAQPAPAPTGSPSPTTDPEAVAQSDALTAENALFADLAEALGSAHPTVLAGTLDSAAAGAVSELRTSGSAATSSDGLELDAGPVIAVLALRSALAGGSGAYGFAESADSPLPEQS